ncbi:DUF5412 domain-containing protein [Bacillus atrophaeus]|uniref:DUF5412 family protein n=1 Tax=Bacillus atrophaeus TaxID=1452 RepID=UPI001EFB90C8|nr:DUF5412 family protein [Bacillus atrophaeus]MCG8396807.1 DUF5412 domain-containing protein [Bacillus atrophaeus]
MNTRSKILLSFSVPLFMFTWLVHWKFFSLNGVPKGTLVQTAESPNGRYAVKIFSSKNSLSADAARGELINNETLVKKTIYWNYPDSNPYVKWLDCRKVRIGNRTLHLDTDETYDWRRDESWVREPPKQTALR